MLDEELRRALVRLRRAEDEFEKSGRLFEDEDFPPCPSADAPSWLRPGQLERHDGRRLGKEEEWELLRGRPLSEDVQQGRLGDCWFLGPLAALAEFQDGRFVRALLPKQRHRSRAGAYVVRLCLAGRWRAVLVDDRLPCRQFAVGDVEEASEQAWGLAFCRTGRLQLWASLVEKGLAKLCGSYEAAGGGLAGDAFPMITGWPCTVMDLDLPAGQPTWELLRELLAGRFLIGCSSRDGVEGDGLETEHVYTLLDAVEVPAPSGSGEARLLKLRDPQKSSDWGGAWSDSSPCWTPELRTRLGCNPGSGRETGVIFLSLEDFFARFSQLSVCEARGSDWWERQVPLARSGGGCQALALEAAVATECVVSLCLPYEHALASKPTAWLSLLRVHERPSAASLSAALAARTRFARESSVSLEFGASAGEVLLLVPFCSVPGQDADGEGCSGAALGGTWAAFSREALRRCEVCRLTWESFKRLEDASTASYDWKDQGPRGLSGNAPPWGESLVLQLAEPLQLS